MTTHNRSTFEQFCGGPFWDSNLTWLNQTPDLTPCFQQTVLEWVPSAWLLLAMPFYIIYLRGTTGPPTPRGRLHVAKIVVSLLLVVTALVRTVLGCVDYQTDHSKPIITIVSPAITAAAYITSVVLIFVERRCGLVTSGVQYILWLLVVLCGIPVFYSKVLNVLDKDSKDDISGFFVTFFFGYFLSLVQWILFSFAEWRPRQRHLGKPACPESYASFLSRITYWWLNGIVFTGYKKSLEESDIWGLNPRDLSMNAAPRLEAAWIKEVERCQRVSPGDSHTHTPHISTYAIQQADDDLGSTPLLSSSPRRGYDSINNHKVAFAPTSKPKTPSLFGVLAGVYGVTLLQAHLCKLVTDILTFVGPELQRLLIRFAEDRSSDSPIWHGFLFAILFFVVSSVKSFFFQQLYHIGLTLGMRVKTAVIALIYKKALTLSNDAKKSATVGEIVNLMSVDAQRLQDVTGYLWMVWSSPFQIAVAVWLLWGLVGPSVLAGLAVMTLLIPVNVLLAARQRKLQVVQMEHKDSRIKLMSEVLDGIKVLKLYAWELAFRGKVADLRDQELVKLQSYSSLAAIGSFSWTLATFLVTLTTFTTYVLLGNVLDAETAFVALSLFNILYFPINLLPIMISYIVTASVSITRLNKFLCQDDLDLQTVGHNPNAEHPIMLSGATLSWGLSAENQPVLTNIDLTVTEGSLVAVVGQVGSGKSSLISAILGEMDKHQGSINVKGQVAYAAQQAWIQNATLRDNILFGKPFHETKYDTVLEACALKPDLEILPGGDLTEIGEKGINLSGGQKQRVSLARAVYNNADVYLLDDPLSAVDAHVGKHIFDQVFSDTGLLKHKTRVLVTHGLHWLPRVDQVVVLVKGHVTETGTYDELLEHDGPFAQYLKTYLLNEEHGADDDEEEDPEAASFRRRELQRLESLGGGAVSSTSETEALSFSDGDDQDEPNELTASSKKTRRKRRHAQRKLLKRGISRTISRVNETGDTSHKHKTDKGPDTLIVQEHAEVGKVKWSVFFAYAKALGLVNAVILLLSYVFYQGAAVGANIWLTEWTNDNTSSNSSEYRQNRDFYLGVFGAFGVGQAFFILVYALVSAYATVRASRELHDMLLLNVLKSPMSFFDTTPSGRILNRFSRDVDTVDSTLPQLIRNWMNTFFIVLSSVVVIAYSTPVFLAVIVPIGILYYVIQKFYIPTSRQLKRLESTTRSPIYAHFSETINGASTIRAYRQQDRFIDTSHARVDTNLVFYFSSIASNRWLGLRLDFVSSCIVLAAALFAVIYAHSLSGAIVGLSISYALQATSELNWMVRVTSDLESNIVSVERLKEYSETPTEADWTNEATRPDEDWPSSGAITFTRYSTRYRDNLDLVLDDVSFRVKAREKVGIVGRTGAGKSSLTLALFRIIEGSGGEIRIDGVHIAQLGLHQLRSRLTILPQDPVLFSGTLRMNIDPLSEYDDAHLWQALERAHLSEYVRSLPDALSHECGEGGKNLSVGQRQLVCLARALLHKTAILVLDEATAAVDLQTDDLIQQTIRTAFVDCTVLTIAHRLNTVMDNDRILVLDKGLVAEYDTPENLLRNDTSIFSGMAREAGLA